MSTVAEPVARRGGVRAFLKLVVIEHSVFALPFVYVAALTAMAAIQTVHTEFWRGGTFGTGGDVGWRDLAAVTVAMVAARTFAMAANRLIDRELDARNPRTASRELVTGAVSLRTVYAGMAVSLVVFLGTAAYLAPICLALAPVAVAPLVLYPYAKRFTWLCHYVLGFAQAIAPVGAWVAVTGRFSAAETPLGGGFLLVSPSVAAAVVLGLAVGTWIAGFDLIYACQDVESDRREGVHSLPARFGVTRALVVSALTHVVTVALLVAFGEIAHFGWYWRLGVALTAAALVYEHAIVRPDDLSRVNRAFFTVNGWIGIGLLAFAVADLVGRGFRP